MDMNIKNADLYFNTKLYADSWFELDEKTKNAALTTAANEIFKLPFIGEKVYLTQETPFPRFVEGVRIDMPKDVTFAIFEQAYALLKAGEEQTQIPEGVQSMSLGGASISFKDTNTPYTLAKETKKCLSGWIKQGFDINSYKFTEVYSA